RSRRFHRVRRHDGLARARARDDAIIPRAHRLPHDRRSGAGLRSRHRLVGSLGLRRARLSSRDDHGHGAVPLSPLPPVKRYAGQGRRRERGARGERHRTRDPRSRAIMAAPPLSARRSYGRTKMPPVSGRGAPVVVGKVSGKPLRSGTARHAEACASSAAAGKPTARAVSTCAGARRSANIRIKVGLRVPPPATIHATGGRGNTVVAWATAAAVMAVSVAAPSCVLLLARWPSSVTQWRNALRSSDLGGGVAKKGCLSTRATAASS